MVAEEGSTDLRHILDLFAFIIEESGKNTPTATPMGPFATKGFPFVANRFLRVEEEQ